MGIKLDWEVESEGGWSEVGEDPRAVAARRRRARRIRNALVGALLLAGLVGGGVYWRLRQVEQQLRADLETTVAAETLALRIGDRAAFLSVQADVGEWQRIQSHTFDEYQALAPRLEANGEIVALEIGTSRAHVTVREVLDGEPYHVLWFYEYDRERGWRHVPPRADFWGEQREMQTTYFTLLYYEKDEALAGALSARLNGWWETACRLTACRSFGEPPRPEVRIEPDPLVEVGWAAYDRNTLLIPSPLLGRVPESGETDPALISALAEQIATRWGETLLGEQPDPYSEVAWVRDELTLWLRHEFDPSAPPSGLFNPLVEAYGPAIVPEYLDLIRRGAGAVPALQQVTGTPVADLPVNWERYFTYRLRAEAAMIAEGFTTEARLLFGDPERTEENGVVDIATEVMAVPESIEVQGVTYFNGTAWAEVWFYRQGASAGDALVTFEPFRVVDDRWVHTLAYFEDWGDLLDERSPHVTLAYHELDASATEGLMAKLEAAYGQAVSDFGLSPAALSVSVLITPSSQPGREAPVAPEGQGAAVVPVAVLSPYASGRRPGVSVQEYLTLTTIQKMIESLVAYEVAPFPPHHPLTVALAGWELERLGVTPPAAQDITPEAFISQPFSIETLWAEDGNMPGFTHGTATAPANELAARVLIDLLVERYGPQAIPALIRYLPDSISLDDWLSRSLGIGTAEIEADWQARLLEEQP